MMILCVFMIGEFRSYQLLGLESNVCLRKEKKEKEVVQRRKGKRRGRRELVSCIVDRSVLMVAEEVRQIHHDEAYE